MKRKRIIVLIALALLIFVFFVIGTYTHIKNKCETNEDEKHDIFRQKEGIEEYAKLKYAEGMYKKNEFKHLLPEDRIINFYFHEGWISVPINIYEFEREYEKTEEISYKDLSEEIMKERIENVLVPFYLEDGSIIYKIVCKSNLYIIWESEKLLKVYKRIDSYEVMVK